MAKQLSYVEIMAMPLHLQAMASEDRRHRARQQEIKQMAASVALLEAEHAKIKAAGHTIFGDNISPVFGKRQAVRINTYLSSAEVSLVKALLIAGFKIVDRSTGVLRTVHLKKGRLNIQVLMSEETLDRAEKAFAAGVGASNATTGAPE
ncbi:hypothetical protein [Cupriavidus sp. IK-TO18]|uniref:hypothetical protein n=1 Tax=Cupriavidus sp. IK-TO18 TaxID=2782182 RepID=UPI00189934CD|nr:hypothetical protein [Cupriavidus sp. IK-TO18]MBF6987219.1 hypothetical protein [Cupriavidus sp. IK-TO18]